MSIATQRLRLRPFAYTDAETFADMHAHPEVMQDYGAVLAPSESDEKLHQYISAFQRHGFSRWAIESLNGNFIGYAGLILVESSHPLGVHVDIGWRLTRDAWGKGYATEAAKAALEDGFLRLGLPEVLGYTAIENVRSQAVMTRLNMQRDKSRDFTMQYDFGSWHGLVWRKNAPIL